jgi:hypothetical protein
VGTYIQKDLYIDMYKIINQCNISKALQKINGDNKMRMHKICPRCGSRNVDWIIPQNWSQCVCRDCDYTGPIIEGNDELAQEIHDEYIKSLKEE